MEELCVAPLWTSASHDTPQGVTRGRPSSLQLTGAQTRAALVLCLVGLPAEIYVSESPRAVHV